MYVSAAACPSVRRHSTSETFLSLQLYIYVVKTAIWTSVCLSPCLFQMARRENKWCRQKCVTVAIGLDIPPSGLWILWAGSAASWTPYSINRHTGALLVETSGTRRPATINGKEEGLGVEFKEVLFDGISIIESGNLAVVLACKIMTSLRLSYLRALAVCKNPSHSASVTSTGYRYVLSYEIGLTYFMIEVLWCILPLHWNEYIKYYCLWLLAR